MNANKESAQERFERLDRRASFLLEWRGTAEKMVREVDANLALAEPLEESEKTDLLTQRNNLTAELASIPNQFRVLARERAIARFELAHEQWLAADQAVDEKRRALVDLQAEIRGHEAEKKTIREQEAQRRISADQVQAQMVALGPRTNADKLADRAAQIAYHKAVMARDVIAIRIKRAYGVDLPLTPSPAELAKIADRIAQAEWAGATGVPVNAQTVQSIWRP